MPDYLTHDELKARIRRAVAEAKRRMETDGPDVALMCALQSIAEPSPGSVYREMVEKVEAMKQARETALKNLAEAEARREAADDCNVPDDHPINQIKPARDPSKECEAGDDYNDGDQLVKRPDRPGDVFEVIATGQYIIGFEYKLNQVCGEDAKWRFSGDLRRVLCAKEAKP